MPIYIWRTE